MINKALIVGGGVGGMSAALSLAKRGVEVHLIDVDPHWRAYGAGISVTGSVAARIRRSGNSRRGARTRLCRIGHPPAEA